MYFQMYAHTRAHACALSVAHANTHTHAHIHTLSRFLSLCLSLPSLVLRRSCTFRLRSGVIAFGFGSRWVSRHIAKFPENLGKTYECDLPEISSLFNKEDLESFSFCWY